MARTRDPRAAKSFCMWISPTGCEAQEPPGNNWDWVILVVDVRHFYHHAVSTVHRVDVVGEGGVAHARHAITDCAHVRPRWQV